MTSAYEINRKKNRPEFPEDREKFGTKFLDSIGDRINETAFGKFRQEGLQKQADLQKKVYESSSPLIQKAIDVANTPNKIEQNILKGISDVTQIDERISTPLTYAAISGGIKGASKIKPKHLGITQTIEPYKPPKGLGKQPRKNMVNITNQVEEALTTPSFTVQEIVKVAKKNKISYAKASEYLKLKKQGIVPTQSINPGTNAGLLTEGASLNQIHARLMQQGKNRGMMYDKEGNPVDPQLRKVDPSIPSEQPIDPGDIPNIDLSTMIEPMRGNTPDVNILSVLNKNGMRGGRLDIFEYRRAGKDRKAVEYYISPYSKMVKFNPVRDKILAAMNQKYGGLQDVLGLGEKRSFQAHHVVPIKASFPAFHGIVKESPKYEYYMKLYAKAILSLGNQIENIVPVIGAVDRDFDAPHHLVHMMMKEVMGAAGEKFWDDTTLESLVVRDGDGKIIGTRNDEMRERLILKQIELFKRGEDIIKLGMEEYSLFQTTTTVPPEEIVDYFTKKLPTDLEYTPELIKQITRDALQDMSGSPSYSVIGGTVSRDAMQIIRDIQSRPANWWSQLNVQGKKAKLPELTESYRGAGDGYTFEDLDELIRQGMLSESTIQKLLAAEKPDFEGFLNELFRD
jgi:hypothetical protein